MPSCLISVKKLRTRYQNEMPTLHMIHNFITIGLDLCRSWMGTINFKGMRKLPPTPVALNEEEINNFGLEDCRDDLSDEPEDDDVIVDTAEADEEAAEFEETIQKVYLGLRVNDMVKITAKNKFFNEDAIVRRLKDGKVFLRFYTYGSMYEEWMNPGEVRKLTNIEILKGLSGPQQPITQRDIDGPSQGDRRRSYDDEQRPGDIRRNLQDSFGGGPRNRRQDRTADRFQRDGDRDKQQSDGKWNSYKDNERRNKGGAYVDGDVEIRGSERQSQRRNNRDDTREQDDVDGQWGRTSQRQERREKRPSQAGSDGGDWSAFVSPSKQRPSQDQTDDFFASLMTDLSKDLASENGSKGSSNKGSVSGVFSSSEDDFFASLISEIEDESSKPPPQKQTKSLASDEDDFFASLVEDIQNDVPKQNPSKSGRKNTPKAPVQPETDEMDFFATLAQEIEGSPERSTKTKTKNKADELDDFFSNLESSVNSESEDFFAGLETELESELSTDSPQIASRSSQEKETAKKSAPKKTPDNSSTSPKPANGATLDKYTVPELKEMLRGKGLKVTGKKAELIERLTQS